MFLKNNIEKIIGKKILISDEMVNAVRLWHSAYKNKAPWIGGDIKSMNLAAAVASEFARQVTLEMKSVISGSVRADMLNEYYMKVLENIRRYTEYACALGGVVFKPFVENGRIDVEFVGGNDFYPTAFNGRGEIISAVFCEKKKAGEQTYVRIEHHEMSKSGVEITNRAYKTGTAFSVGSEIPLSDVEEWSDIAPYIFLPGVERPLFAYFKIPFANNIDMHSPLGVSVFSRAIDIIREADMQYSRLLWEFEGGELAIDANIDAVKAIDDDFVMPHLKKRLFRGLDIDSGGSDLYSVFAPNLRDKSLINGLDQLLVRVEDLCGLARGVFSDVEGNIRTATELKLLRQRTYSSVTDIQKALSGTLTNLTECMDILCDIYRLAPKGQYSVTFDFDDSTVTDRQSEFLERQELVDRGILSKWEMRMWYLGESEEQAKRIVEENERFEAAQKNMAANASDLPETAAAQIPEKSK